MLVGVRDATLKCRKKNHVTIMFFKIASFFLIISSHSFCIGFCCWQLLLQLFVASSGEHAAIGIERSSRTGRNLSAVIGFDVIIMQSL